MGINLKKKTLKFLVWADNPSLVIELYSVIAERNFAPLSFAVCNRVQMIQRRIISKAEKNNDDAVKKIIKIITTAVDSSLRRLRASHLFSSIAPSPFDGVVSWGIVVERFSRQPNVVG